MAGLTLCVLLCSCGRSGQPRKETFPVTGEVSVDGKSVERLAVTCHAVQGIDTEHPTYSQAFTDKDGKFKISTYQQADGVPEGEYAITFFWGEMNLLSMTYGGPDKLKDRYNDPKKSTFRIKVEKGKPTDLGKIELTTK